MARKAKAEQAQNTTPANAREMIRVKVADIVPYVRNSRTHSDAQVAQIAASIREFGWTNPVLIRPDNTLVAGHGRVLAAQKLGLAEVPAIVLGDLTAAQIRALVIADNKLALNAGWDMDMLSSELTALRDEDGFDLSLTGFGEDELADMFADPLEDDPEDAGEQDNSPQRVSLGDVWVLGRHRLVCGDCSSQAVVDAALDGRQPDLIVYDPPYDVPETWTYLQPAPAVLVFHDYRRAVVAANLLSHFAHSYQFVWDGVTSWYTPNRPLARHKAAIYASNNADWDFDAAVYVDGKIREAKKVSNTRGDLEYVPLSGGRVHLQTVFQLPNTKVGGDEAHAHAKPIEWLRALIKGSRATVILDQFAGSGASLIAAPDSVSVSAIELNPRTCDAILARWERTFGELAVRETAAKEPHR